MGGLARVGNPHGGPAVYFRRSDDVKHGYHGGLRGQAPPERCEAMKTLRPTFLSLALAWLVLCAPALHAASPPPPPPPAPEGLEAAYDGYPTEYLWSGYLTWVRAQTHVRRAAAFEAMDLSWSNEPGAWVSRGDGPRYESTSFWIPHGSLFAFDFICPVDADFDDDAACQWRYRGAFFDAREGDVHAIVYDTFDADAFAARLRAAGVAPEALDYTFTSDFGLAGLVNARLDALIVTRDIREEACPAVGEAIAALADRSIPLSPFGPPPGTPEPPAPMPPGADRETLTFPLGFYPDIDAELTISGSGAGSMREMLSQLVGPVRACF